MFRTAAVALLLVILSVVSAVSAVPAVSIGAAPRQKPAPPKAASGPANVANPCEVDGVILCDINEIDTVTSPRSLEDMRIIGHYLRLVTERNRRYYLTWQTKAPSAAFELVKRVKSFPHLPIGGDTYSIVGLDIAISQSSDRVTVRYPKKPLKSLTSRVPDGDLVTYDAKLSDFIRTLEKEIEKLRKFEKAPGFFD